MAKFLQARRRPVKHRKKKLWAVKKPVASTGSSVRVTEQTEGKRSWYLSVTAAAWFRFADIRNTVNSIVHSVLNTYITSYLWCFNSLMKQVLFLKNIVSPPILYHGEVRALKKRLHKLELEFLKLQLSLSDKVKISGSSENSGRCSCGQATTASSIKESVEATKINQLLSVAPHSLSPPPPPPLPPPPPPPLPPPPPFPPSIFLTVPIPPPALQLQNRLPLLKKVENSRPPKMPPAKQDGPVPITLKDLMNVKLRKASDIYRRNMGSGKYDGISQITISDLKSASKMPPKRLVHVSKETLNKSPLDLRRHLRKVNMVRSPGGTPVYDRDNKENGSGLTPLMTKALRRKFQMAHPKSPSPLAMSPTNQGLE